MAPVLDARPAARLMWRAMGCEAEVVVVGGRNPQALARRSRAVVDDCERRWSRFRAGSELGRINAAAAQHAVFAVVSRPTIELLVRACAAWRATGGRYDPTLLRAVEAAGYAGPFRDGSPSQGPSAPHAGDGSAPGCDQIDIDPDRCTVRVPQGLGIDPGGIGKGYAADLAVDAARDAGAHGALVCIGGDLRVWGEAPDDQGWTVGIEDPWDRQLQRARISVGPAGAAVATSSPLARTWNGRDGERQHHIIDPATRRPAVTDLASVTVVADHGWQAETWAKAACIAGSDDGPAILDAAGWPGLFVTADGRSSATSTLLGWLA